MIDPLSIEIHMPPQDSKMGEIRKSNFIGPGTRPNKRLEKGRGPKKSSEPMSAFESL